MDDPTVQFLHALAGAHARGLLDVRLILPSGAVRRRFFTITQTGAAATAINRAAAFGDAYVGAAIRARPHGGRAGVDDVRVLWADCDDAACAERLERFDPPPSVVVRSGSPHGRHAYWLLDAPLAPAHAERANRRLADALGADGRSTDAARVLRPPGTLNHKHRPPAPIKLEHLDDRRWPASTVVGGLPDAPTDVASGRDLRRTKRTETALALPPDVYVERLLGVPVPRSRKIRCPFHDDRRPSLHVYAEPERGWFCFGCRRGGSVYDLAAAHWRLGTRGADFLELRRRLAAAGLG